jgi:hypothetical protein
VRARLLPLALFVSFAALPGATINQSEAGLLAYLYVGGSINLTNFNNFANATNSSGLYTPMIVNQINWTENYTDGPTSFIAGTNNSPAFCISAPYYFEDALVVSERGCPDLPVFQGFGYAGGTSIHLDYTSSPHPTTDCLGCTSTWVNIRSRVRADGWVLVYQASRNAPSTPRSSYLRWTAGGRGNTSGVVDDTLMGVIMNRTLEVIRSSSANTTPLPTYTPTLPAYYDFGFPDATLLLFGSRSVPTSGYTPSSYAMSFSRGSLAVKWAGLSLRARGSGTSYYIGGASSSNRIACVSSGLGSGSDTSIAPTVTFTAGFNATGPVPDGCPTVFTSRHGSPFFAVELNTTVHSIPANTWVNITHDGTEAKIGMLMILG